MDSFAQINSLLEQMPAFVLALFRIGGLMILAPFFGSASIPPRVKIALTLVLTIAVWPTLPRVVPLPDTLAGVAVGVGSELLVGLTIGLAVSTIFAGLQLAGLTIGQQMGVALGDVFNPGFDDSVDVMGAGLYWVGLVMFLLIGGHRMLLGSLIDSFRLVPAGAFTVDARWVGLLGGMLTAAFLMAFKIALPVVLSLFLVSVAMGLVNRTVPQFNILTAGFAIRAGVGLLLLAATLMATLSVLHGTVEHAMDTLNVALSKWVT